MKRANSKGLLLAYYADDFTGSTDALESLAQAGLKTVLFLDPPTPAQLAQFPGLRAFGIVGGSRVMSVAEMNRELPPAFKALKRSGAAILHYKTCSTFDSSPTVGSIGRAIEIGREVFGKRLTPLVVGFPAFGRHVVFGNLFARSGDSPVFRLDRHPMSHHPVTPMNEADLRVHLSRQTRLPMELVDILALKACQTALKRVALQNLETLERRLNAMAVAKLPPVVLFDTLDADDLPFVGRLISSLQTDGKQLFCAGSSGVGRALTAYWRACGAIRPPSSVAGPLAKNKQMVIISGSCSPVTDRQIARALKAGFAEVACDTHALAQTARADAGIQAAVTKASLALGAGRHVIFHTARGAADTRRHDFERAARNGAGRSAAAKMAAARASLGDSLGKIMALALEKSGARRAVICGGDTSTQAGRALGIQALEYLAPAATGAPWCKVHAPGAAIDGSQLICKGGQVGSDDFLVRLAEGAI